MRGKSSSPSEEGGSRTAGGELQLYRSQGAELYLIDGQESVLMQMGNLTFFLVKHSRSPLAAVVAMVGDVQWPVGKDSPVMKVGDRRFTFALPGLMYGLVLSERVSADDLQRLDVLLQEYTLFELHPEISTGVESQDQMLEQQASNYWTRVAADVESTGAKMVEQSQNRWWAGATSTIERGGQMAALSLRRDFADEVTPLGAAAATALTGRISPRMISRMQQARRMSAVAKLFARTVQKGAISPTSHVEATEGGGVLESGGELSVASVDAVAKVLGAVESAGKTLLETAGPAGTAWVQRRYGEQARQTTAESLGAVGRLINAAWTLNKVGLRMLFRATAASTAINSGARPSSSSSDARPTNSYGVNSKRSSDDTQTTSGYCGSSLGSSSSTSHSASSPRFPHLRIADASVHFPRSPPPPRHPPPPPPPPPFHPPPPHPHSIVHHPPPPFHLYPGSATTAPPPTTSPFLQRSPVHQDSRLYVDAPIRPRTRPRPSPPAPHDPSL